MPKVIVTRFIPKEKCDSSNLPHTETCEYSIEDACSQGFLCSMVDGLHEIHVKLSEDEV